MDLFTRGTLLFSTYSLRESYLLKKYCRVWLRKTFGRVSPTRARAFYLCRLRAKLFYFWKEDICYSSRWLLTVRADCNNKYRLWIKYLNAWKRYVLLMRFEKEQEAMADQLKSKFYTRNFFPAWKDFILIKRFDKQQANAATEFYLRNRLRQTFHIWKEELACKREYNEMRIRSQSQYAISLQGRVWHLWLFILQQRAGDMVSCTAASKYYNTKLVGNCFEFLRDYALRRRNYKLVYWNLKRDYEHRLVGRFLKVWRVRRWKENNLREKHRQIQALVYRCRARRLWLAWQDYTSTRRLEREREKSARSFRVFALKSNSWKCLVSAYRQKRVTQWNSQIALSLWVLWRYRHAWNEWELKMDERIELKQEPVTRLARRHNMRVVLARAFSGFKSYWAARGAKKERYRMIAEYYQRILRRKCISSFKLYIQRQHIEREHSNLSHRFLREIFLNHYFYTWLESLELQRENNELMERAQCSHSCVLLHSFFMHWRERHTLVNQQKMRLITADMSFRLSLQKSKFLAWKQFVLLCQKQRKAKKFAIYKYQTKILGKCFTRMKQIFDRNEFIRLRCRGLISLLDLTSVRRAFRAWQDYIVLVREEKRVTLMAERHSNIKVELQALRVWYENTKFIKIQKGRYRLAQEFRNKYLVSRTFHFWQYTQTTLLERRLCESERASKATAVINRGCLARCFWGWLNLRDKTVIKRYHKMKSDNYYYRCLILRSLTHWKNELLGRRRFILMYQRACWFHLSSLLARSYTQWRLQLNSQLYYNHRRTLALWCWSRALERKAFYALRDNASECRRKRERYERASDEFKDRVVRKGLLQLLHAGSIMLTADETSVLRHIERTTKYSWGCALRCARIWRHKTLASKKNGWREAKRCALSVPSIQSSIQRQHRSGVDKFWSEITDLTVKGNSLPAPRIPDFMKEPGNPIACSTELGDSSDQIAEPNPTVIDAGVKTSTQPEEMVNITKSDLKLLQDTKEQLIQLYESKLLLKSVRERLAESLSDRGSAEQENMLGINNRVRQIEETIQRLEFSIRRNIDSFTKHFSIPSDLAKNSCNY